MIANLAGASIYLNLARTTWDIDHALGGLFLEVGALRFELALFGFVNLIWLVFISLRAHGLPRIKGIIPWASMIGLWCVILVIDWQIFSRYVDQARSLLN